MEAKKRITSSFSVFAKRLWNVRNERARRVGRFSPPDAENLNCFFWCPFSSQMIRSSPLDSILGWGISSKSFCSTIHGPPHRCSGNQPKSLRPLSAQKSPSEKSSGRNESNARNPGSIKTTPGRKSMGARTASAKRRKREHDDKIYTLYTKAFGDAIMITATHLASDRIDLMEQPVLIASVVSVWWLVSGFQRDYDYRPDFEGPSAMEITMGLPVLYGVTSALITWLRVIPGVLGIFSLMVSQNLIGTSLVMPTINFFSGTGSTGVPAELEVLLALAVTIACWRGIHAGLRGQ